MSKPTIAPAAAPAAGGASGAALGGASALRNATNRKAAIAAAVDQVAGRGHQLDDWIALLDQQREQAVNGPDDVIADLYFQATDNLDIKYRKTPDFAHIWLGHGRLQMAMGASSSDVRDTFKYMKSERIAQDQKMFYVARSELERRAGNSEKSKDLAKQGSRYDSSPLSDAAQKREANFAAFLSRSSSSSSSLPPSAAASPSSFSTSSASSLFPSHASSTHTPSPILEETADEATATIMMAATSLNPPSSASAAHRKPAGLSIRSTPAAKNPTAGAATSATATRVPASATRARRAGRRGAFGGKLQALRVSATSSANVADDDDDTEAPTVPVAAAAVPPKQPFGEMLTPVPSRSNSVSPELTEVYLGVPTPTEMKAKNKKVTSVLGSNEDATVQVTAPTPTSTTAVATSSKKKGGLRSRASLEEPVTGIVHVDQEIEFKMPKKPRLTPGGSNASSATSSINYSLQQQQDATATVPINIGNNTTGSVFKTPMTSRQSSGFRSTTGRRSASARPPTGRSTLGLGTPVAYGSRSMATPGSSTRGSAADLMQTPTATVVAMPRITEVTPVQAPLKLTVPAATFPAAAAAGTAAVAAAPGFNFSGKTEIVIINGESYQKLDRIGKGGSSNVYKVIGRDCKLYALKEVDLSSADQETIDSYENEIELLQNLQGSPYIIKMKGWEINRAAGHIHILLEVGDADLNTVLKNRRKAKKGIDGNYLRLYWQQMLEAVHCVHQANVVHSDLKPANFLFVEGNLKLIDFGIAKAIQEDQTSAMRDSAVGTLNYMAPESITNQSMVPTHGKKGPQCLKIGPAADVWSLGCILYSMTYGKTPFQHLNPLQKLQAIVNPDYEIAFPANKAHPGGLVQVMKACLLRGVKERPTIPQLLQHKFLNPTAAATPKTATPKASTGLSQEQLYAVLRQLGPQNGVMESPGMLSRRIFSQLADGGDLRLGSSPTAAAAAPPKMPSLLKSSLANAAASSSSSSGNGRGAPLQSLDMNALKSRKTALKKVQHVAKPNPNSIRDDGSVESMLRRGLNSKFKNAHNDVTSEVTATEWGI